MISVFVSKIFRKKMKKKTRKRYKTNSKLTEFTVSVLEIKFIVKQIISNIVDMFSNNRNCGQARQTSFNNSTYHFAYPE